MWRSIEFGVVIINMIRLLSFLSICKSMLRTKNHLPLILGGQGEACFMLASCTSRPFRGEPTSLLRNELGGANLRFSLNGVHYFIGHKLGRLFVTLRLWFFLSNL